MEHFVGSKSCSPLSIFSFIQQSPRLKLLEEAFFHTRNLCQEPQSLLSTFPCYKTARFRDRLSNTELDDGFFESFPEYNEPYADILLHIENHYSFVNSNPYTPIVTGKRAVL